MGEAALVEDLPRMFPQDYWLEKSEKGVFPEEFWQECGSRRLPGFLIPEEYGGLGRKLEELVNVVVFLASHGFGTALYPVLSNNMSALVLLNAGPQRLREKILPKLASGEYMMGLAITERESGSDVLSITTSATKTGNAYRINGEKMFVNNVGRATHVLLAARTTPAEKVVKKSDGITLFIMDLRSEGLGFNILEKMGTNYYKTGVMKIVDVFIDEEMVVGEIDKGWRALTYALNPDRIVYAALGAGSALYAVKTAASYAAERKVFGKPIGGYQGIQLPLAANYAEAEAARLLCLEAARAFDRGERSDVLACMAKYLASETAFKALSHALQVLGGYGYLKEKHVERVFRDVLLLKSGPITQELALAYVAEKALSLPRSY
ncbi:MAG: acyl-CoA dehydrogenase family protein [Candidatus Caldarchaeum sp.]